MRTKQILRGMVALSLAMCMFSNLLTASYAGDRNSKKDCNHELTYQVVKKVADESQDGIIDTCCRRCGYVVEEKTIHAYKTYVIELESDKYATIKGWLESDYNDTCCEKGKEYLDNKSMSCEVIDMLNLYRTENGRKTLEWNCDLQAVADLRAIEAAYSFAHIRPNGEEWYMADESMLGGENLARGYKNPERVMQGWKKSKTHNENLLLDSFKSIAVGVFHLYQFTEEDNVPKEKIVWAQSFSYMLSP